MVWKCAGPRVCTHLPETGHSLLGTLCSCYSGCIQGHTEQSGGTGPSPQHLAHRHLIRTCFYENWSCLSAQCIQSVAVGHLDPSSLHVR